MKIKLRQLITEANRFEKELKKMPLDKQLELRKRNMAELLRQTGTSSPEQYFRDYGDGERFRSLNYYGLSNNLNNLDKSKQKEFGKDLKNSYRGLTRNLLNNGETKDEIIKRNIKSKMFNKKYGTNEPISEPYYDSDKKVQINHAGAYENIDTQLKRKIGLSKDQNNSKTGMWVHPISNDPELIDHGANSSAPISGTYKDRPLWFGLTPARYSGETKARDLQKVANNYEAFITPDKYNDSMKNSLKKERVYPDIEMYNPPLSMADEVNKINEKYNKKN